MADITAIILTKNERGNIADSIASIQGLVKRIVVVDSESTDDTLKIAESLGADVYVNKFENYSKQFNWGIDNTNINSKWILRLDADERLTPKLCDELEQLLEKYENDDVNGITLEADFYFLGRCIKYGGRKKRKIMIFKNGYGRIENRKMDEHTIISSGRSIAAKERFIHYDFRNVDFFISKMNWYATREMQDYFDYSSGNINEKLHDKKLTAIRRKKFGFYYRFPLFVRSWLLFVYIYIFKLGFLDGKEGFIYHYMYQRWYRCLVDAKIYEQRLTNKPFEETGDLRIS